MKKFTFGGAVATLATLTTTLLALSMPVNAEEAHSHVYNQVGKVAPTCTAQGYYMYECDCGVQKRTYISAMGHNYASKGYQTYNSSQHRMVRQCTRCGAQQYSYASHNFNITTTAPKCTSAGKKVYRCTTCGYSRTETIAATGHTYVSKGYQNYSSSQHRMVRQCSKCGVNAYSYANHNFSVTTTSPTCTASGRRVYRCNTCGYSRTETISAMGHRYASKGYQTYSSTQHRIVRQCTRCGMNTYSYASHAFAKYAETATQIRYKCSACGTMKTVAK